MRIMHIGHTLLAAVNQEKLACMESHGHPGAVVAPKNWKSGSLFGGEQFPLARPYDAISYSDLPVWRSGHIASFLYSPTSLRNAIRQFSPDVIHIEQEVYSFAAAEICLLLRGSNQIVTVFGWENLDRRIHPLQKICRKIVLRRADGIIGGSVNAVTLMERYGYTGPTLVAPEYGVYRDFLEAPRRRPNSKPVIGFVGRHDFAKGGDLLVEAMAKIAAKNHEFSAQFLGSGDQKAEWVSMAETHGIADKIKWLETVRHKEVPAIMSAIDILVVPSRTVENWAEQFGQVITQAMALSIPVIGSDSGAIPEVIGRDDLIFPENDSDGIASLLARMLEDPEFRKTTADYGRDRVEKHYTNEVLSRKYLAFWESLTAHKAHSHARSA